MAMATPTRLKIVSGGQTGADIAALDWAIARGIPHGGWCPKGRKCERGAIPARYALTETEGEDYASRTERNVIDSDATVIITLAPVLGGGSKLTRDFALRHRKPVLHIHAGTSQRGWLLAAFMRQHKVTVLNVAGPRASVARGVGRLVKATLEEAWQFLATQTPKSRVLEP